MERSKIKACQLRLYDFEKMIYAILRTISGHLKRGGGRRKLVATSTVRYFPKFSRISKFKSHIKSDGKGAVRWEKLGNKINFNLLIRKMFRSIFLSKNINKNKKKSYFIHFKNNFNYHLKKIKINYAAQNINYFIYFYQFINKFA